MTYFTADTTTIKDLFTLSAADISLSSLLICTACSLVIGAVVAAVFCRGQRTSRGYALTLALLPAIVQMVIMLVNGNIGTGVAVMGAFSLVRFRSAPGTAREIGVLFLGMAIGLATGMGYVGLAALTFVIVSAVLMALTALGLGQKDAGERLLKITIPEDLDYEGLFDDLFAQYTTSHTLVRVKTSNMGTLYELEYRVTLRSESIPKEFLDALRCRNGNLNIVCGRELVKDAL